MRGLIGGVMVMAMALAGAPVALAQAEWSSVAKITNGSCGDGAIAQIVERAGTMNIKTFINGKPNADFDVKLNPDGSGIADSKGQMGRVRFEIAAGSGKRPMKSSQLEDRLCQWAWTPK